MKKYFLFVLVFIYVSCNNKQLLNDDIFITSLKSYYSSGNKTELERAYIVLKNNINDKDVLLEYDKKSVINTFMILKRYEELIILLKNQKFIDYNDKLTLNILNYIIEKKKGNEYTSFIKNNIKIIQDTLVKTPNDSLLYIDYF